VDGFFSKLNYKWVYRPGRANVADPLSRYSAMSSNVTLNSFSNPNNSIYKAIVNAYELDEKFSNPQYIRNFTTSPSGVYLKKLRGGGNG